MATITRADLLDAIHREIGLPRREAAVLVDMVIEAIAEQLEAGERVAISGFGSFGLRDKAPRMGRNPRTGEAAPISARRVVVFRPSAVLKTRIQDGLADAGREDRVPAGGVGAWRPLRYPAVRAGPLRLPRRAA